MKNTIKKQDYHSELRSKYHSFNSEERNEAIRELASQKSSDSTRELIHVFNECGWRETQFQILKVLPLNPDIRSLEFLFELIYQSTQNQQLKSDLPMTEAAIIALGETKSQKAALFLRNYYGIAPESLKPACITAIGLLADRKMIPLFIQNLRDSYKTQQIYLTKSLILSLGDLKAHSAVPELMMIAHEKKNRDLALSAIVSLGKICRDPRKFEEFEFKYKNDQFENQIVQNAKVQTQFRSSWKIEDYLNKILTDNQIHPSLFLEFSAFSTDDVKAALDMLNEPDHQKNLLKVLAKIDFPEVKTWYSEYITNLDQQNRKEALMSMIEHADSAFYSLIQKHFNLSDQRYITAIFVSSVQPDREIDHLIQSEIFKNSNETEKIQFLNEVYLYIMTLIPQQNLLKNCCKKIENWVLENEKDLTPLVLSRTFRIFSQLNYANKKLSVLGLKLLKIDSIRPSVYNYFENDPEILTKNEIENYLINAVDFKHWLNIIIKNKINLFATNQYDHLFVKIRDLKSIDLDLLYLKLVVLFQPIKEKENILRYKDSQHEVIQFHFILAIKAYKSEMDADLLLPYLESKSASLSGRALDALLNLPGNRAKRLVTEFAVKNYLIPGVIEKICRTMTMPDTSTDYFAQQYGNIIKHIEDKNMSFADLDQLKYFHQQLVFHVSSNKTEQRQLSEKEIIEIDQEIEKLITTYSQFDETSKAALRSAEINYKLPESASQYVDKSSIVLGYSKAIDIIFEKQLGRKIIFPKLEYKLSEFQNVIHALGLNEDFPNAEKLLQLLQLEKHFSPQSLPVHKMRLVAQGIFNGKIINEHFKILDGLRAWAIILLLFARKNKVMPQPIIVAIEDENLCIQLAKKLMWLQDIRNPIAHRQTVLNQKDIEQIRNEVFMILKMMNRFLFD